MGGIDWRAWQVLAFVPAVHVAWRARAIRFSRRWPCVRGTLLEHAVRFTDIARYLRGETATAAAMTPIFTTSGSRTPTKWVAGATSPHAPDPARLEQDRMFRRDRRLGGIPARRTDHGRLPRSETPRARDAVRAMDGPRMSHSRSFQSWPFPDAVNTASFTTRQVLEGLCPIAEVYHDHDGDWQFLCGTTTDVADLKLVCMGCMLERDPSLSGLADLPPGWRAVREDPHSEWSRDEYDDRDDEV